MNTKNLTSPVKVDDVIAALRRMPIKYLGDVLQFIEFIEYKTMAGGDDAENETLWTAVEFNQAYKKQFPDEPLEQYASGKDFLKAVADL